MMHYERRLLDPVVGVDPMVGVDPTRG
jgi:hypothetical protein